MSHRTASPGRVAAAERSLRKGQRDGSIAGQVHSTVAGPATFHANGSVSRQQFAKGVGWLTGWGYLATDGRYGCGRYPQCTGRAGSDRAVVAELRAIWHAAGTALQVEPVIVVTSSEHAATVLAAWQRGGVAMPAGYTGRSRGVPTLERLRQVVAAHPGRLTVRRIPAGAGDVLHEGADTLAQLGMRWTRDDLADDEVARRAAGIAEGFLADYLSRGRR